MAKGRGDSVRTQLMYPQEVCLDWTNPLLLYFVQCQHSVGYSLPQRHGGVHMQVQYAACTHLWAG